jgi:hypothetical protein
MRKIWRTLVKRFRYCCYLEAFYYASELRGQRLMNRMHGRVAGDHIGLLSIVAFRVNTATSLGQVRRQVDTPPQHYLDFRGLGF